MLALIVVIIVVFVAAAVVALVVVVVVVVVVVDLYSFHCPGFPLVLQKTPKIPSSGKSQEVAVGVARAHF